MKYLLIAGLLAVSANTASAQAFDFQRQIGSTEYNLNEDTENMTLAPVIRSNRLPSLSANVDGIAMDEFTGNIVKSGPSRISLYEIQRGSPEGIAYRDYHERYAPSTDWEAVASEYRSRNMSRELASGAESKEGNS
jgi:hypothetical protein